MAPTQSIYDYQREVIEMAVGDVFCIKQQAPNGWWTLRHPDHPRSSGCIRVLVGWNGEAIIAPLWPGREAKTTEAVTIGRDLPEHVSMNLIHRVVTEMLESIADLERLP